MKLTQWYNNLPQWAKIVTTAVIMGGLFVGFIFAVTSIM